MEAQAQTHWRYWDEDLVDENDRHIPYYAGTTFLKTQVDDKDTFSPKAAQWLDTDLKIFPYIEASPDFSQITLSMISRPGFVPTTEIPYYVDERGQMVLMSGFPPPDDFDYIGDPVYTNGRESEDIAKEQGWTYFGTYIVNGVTLVIETPDANRFFVGTGANATQRRYNRSQNWSTTWNGAGGSSVPGAADTAYYTSGGGNCTVDLATVTVQAIYTSDGGGHNYAGTLDTNGVPMHITSLLSHTNGTIRNAGVFQVDGNFTMTGTWTNVFGSIRIGASCAWNATLTTTYFRFGVSAATITFTTGNVITVVSEFNIGGVAASHAVFTCAGDYTFDFGASITVKACVDMNIDHMQLGAGDTLVAFDCTNNLNNDADITFATEQYVAQATGDWNTDATWASLGLTHPGAGNTWNIPAAYTVSVKGNCACGQGFVGGTLSFNGQANTVVALLAADVDASIQVLNAGVVSSTSCGTTGYAKLTGAEIKTIGTGDIQFGTYWHMDAVCLCSTFTLDNGEKITLDGDCDNDLGFTLAAGSEFIDGGHIWSLRTGSMNFNGTYTATGTLNCMGDHVMSGTGMTFKTVICGHSPGNVTYTNNVTISDTLIINAGDTVTLDCASNSVSMIFTKTTANPTLTITDNNALRAVNTSAGNFAGITGNATKDVQVLTGTVYYDYEANFWRIGYIDTQVTQTTGAGTNAVEILATAKHQWDAITVTAGDTVKTATYTMTADGTLTVSGTLGTTPASAWTLDCNGACTMSGSPTFNTPTAGGAMTIAGDCIGNAGMTWNQNGVTCILDGVTQQLNGFATASTTKVMGNLDIRTSTTLTVGSVYVGYFPQSVTLTFNMTGALAGPGSIVSYVNNVNYLVATSMPSNWGGVSWEMFIYSDLNMPAHTVTGAGTVRWACSGTRAMTVGGNISVGCSTFDNYSWGPGAFSMALSTRIFTVNSSGTCTFGNSTTNTVSIAVTTGSIILTAATGITVTSGATLGSNSNYVCDINSSFTNAGTWNMPAAAGTCTCASTTFTCTGTCNNDGGTCVFDRAGTTTLGSNATAFYRVTISNGTTLDTGAASSFSFTCAKSCIIGQGVSGVLICNASTISIGSGGITVGYDLQLWTGATFTGGTGPHTFGGIDCGINGVTTTFNCTTNTTTMNGNGIDGGAISYCIITKVGTTWNHNGGTFNFTLAGAQSWWDYNNTARTMFSTLTVTKGAGNTLQFFNTKGFNLTVAAALTITSGTFSTVETVSGVSRNLTVTGATSITGVLTCNASTISTAAVTINDGGLMSNMTATTTMSGNLIVGGGASGSYTFTTGSLAASGTVVVNGSAAFGSNTAWTFTQNSTLNSAGTYNAPTGATWTAKGNITLSSTFNADGGTCTCTTNTFYISENAAGNFYNIIVNANTKTINVEDYALGVTNNLTVTAGTLTTLDSDTVTSRNLTVTNLTSISATLMCNASTISLGSGLTGATYAVTIATGGLLTGGTGAHTYGNIAINTGGTWSCTNNVAGTILNGKGTGSYIYDQDGTVTNNSGLITMTYAGACNADLNGAAGHPYNLTLNNAALAVTMQDSAGTVDNNLTITTGSLATNGWGLTVTAATALTGTLTCSNSAISLGSGLVGFVYALYVYAGGTFTGGTGAHTIGMMRQDATGSITLTSNTTTINSGIGGGMNTCMYLVTADFHHNNGTLNFTYAGTQTLCETANNAVSFYTMTVAKGAGNTLQYFNAYGFNLTVSNNLTVTSGTFSTIETVTGVSRNLSVTKFTDITGVLTCNASTCAFGSGLATEFSYGLAVNAGGTFTGGTGPHSIGTMSNVATGSLTLTSNTTTVNGRISGGTNVCMNLVAADFHNGSGTLNFTYAGDQLLREAASAAVSFYTMTVTKGAGNTLQYANGKGFALTANALTITSGTFDTSEVTSGTSRNLTVNTTASISDTLSLHSSTYTNGTAGASGATTVNAGGEIRMGAATTFTGAAAAFPYTLTLNTGTIDWDYGGAASTVLMRYGLMDIMTDTTTGGGGVTITGTQFSIQASQNGTGAVIRTITVSLGDALTITDNCNWTNNGLGAITADLDMVITGTLNYTGTPTITNNGGVSGATPGSTKLYGTGSIAVYNYTVTNHNSSIDCYSKFGAPSNGSSTTITIANVLTCSASTFTGFDAGNGAGTTLTIYLGTAGSAGSIANATSNVDFMNHDGTRQIVMEGVANAFKGVVGTANTVDMDHTANGHLSMKWVSFYSGQATGGVNNLTFTVTGDITVANFTCESGDTSYFIVPGTVISGAAGTFTMKSTTMTGTALNPIIITGLSKVQTDVAAGRAVSMAYVNITNGAASTLPVLQIYSDDGTQTYDHLVCVAGAASQNALDFWPTGMTMIYFTNCTFTGPNGVTQTKMDIRNHDGWLIMDNCIATNNKVITDNNTKPILSKNHNGVANDWSYWGNTNTNTPPAGYNAAAWTAATNVTVTSSWIGGSASTVTLNETAVCNNLTLNGVAQAANLTMTTQLTASGDAIVGSGTKASTLLTAAFDYTFRSMTIALLGVYTAPANVTYITAADGANIAWSNSGTFNNGTGTVAFQGHLSPFIIKGDNLWNVLEIVVADGPTYQFESAKTQTVATYCHINGNSTNDLVLDATGVGDWILTLNVGCTQDFAYLDVHNSDASLGLTCVAAFSTDGGGNHNWIFGPAGTYIWDGGGPNNLASNRFNWTGDVTPGATDDCLYTLVSNKACTWDIASNSGHIQADINYTNTITMNNGVTWSTLDIAACTWATNGKTINLIGQLTATDTSVITATVATVLTIGSHLNMSDTVTVGNNLGYTMHLDGDLNLAGGDLYAPSSTGGFTMAGDFWNRTGGVWHHDNGTVTFNTTFTTSPTASEIFWGMAVTGPATFDTTGANFDITILQDLTNAGALTMNGSILTLGTTTHTTIFTNTGIVTVGTSTMRILDQCSAVLVGVPEFPVISFEGPAGWLYSHDHDGIANEDHYFGEMNTSDAPAGYQAINWTDAHLHIREADVYTNPFPTKITLDEVGASWVQKILYAKTQFTIDQGASMA